MSKSVGNVVDPLLVIEGGKDEKADVTSSFNLKLGKNAFFDDFRERSRPTVLTCCGSGWPPLTSPQTCSSAATSWPRQDCEPPIIYVQI